MSFVRPEIAAGLFAARELIAALAISAFGLWLIWLGGYLLTPLGLGILGIGGGSAVLAWRRMRFGQAGEAPGAVEVDEGQIAYFGPRVGGVVGIPDLAEVALVTLRGRRLWQLKEANGQSLLIPVEAAGAERLFDAFAALPGMDTATLIAALNPQTEARGRALATEVEERSVWRRKGAGVVVR